jgi:predicted Fe-Mo cluster-binding NifX family protein
VKIAVSATRSSVDAPLEEMLERCCCFVIADQGGAVYEPVRRSRRSPVFGAAAECSRLLVERGVSVVLTGTCDPEALDCLASAGLYVVTGCSGSVAQVLMRFNTELDGFFVDDGEASSSDDANADDSAFDPGQGIAGGGMRRRRLFD